MMLHVGDNLTVFSLDGNQYVLVDDEGNKFNISRGNTKIEMSICGGVIEVEQLPLGITIAVRDYDCEGYVQAVLDEDADGKKFLLMEFGK